MSTGNPAPPEAVGRICPYCRVALEEGALIVFCTSCGAVHHDDCWEENGGCAVALCAGGPSMRADDQEEAGEAPTTVAPVAAPPAPVPAAPSPAAPAPPGAVPGPPPPATPPPPAAPVSPPPAAPATPASPPPAAPASPSAAAPPPPPGAPAPAPAGSGRNWIPLLAVAIVLLGGGAAAAIAIGGNHGGSSTTVETAAASAEEPEPVEPEEEPLAEEEGFEEEEEFEPEPELTPDQLARRQVQQALRSHFNDLASDHYYAAYRGLTPTEGEEIGGESSWVSAQEEDQLQSFQLTVRTALLGSNSARARIDEFRTESLASGCKEWSGYWEMTKVYGEWLISAAKLESEPC